MRIPPRPGRHRPAVAARLLLLAPLVAGLAAGCATGGPHARQDAAREQEADVTLFVKNYYWGPIHIYVMGAGQTVSLGQLASMNTTTYTVPRMILATGGGIRLVADPIGSTSAYISEPVYVTPGDRVMWTIQNYLPQSSISIQ